MISYPVIKPALDALIAQGRRISPSLCKPAPSSFAGTPSAIRQAGSLLEALASLAPQTLAVAHGASFSGDGAIALRQLASALAA